MGMTRRSNYHKKFLQFLQMGYRALGAEMPGPYVHAGCDSAGLSRCALHRGAPRPDAVLGSVAHLTAVLRKPFLRNIDQSRSARRLPSAVDEGANLLLEFDRRADVPAERKTMCIMMS